MKGALDDEVGLSPIVFEMRTVAHFMAAGFDVEFRDLCEGGGCDFLVRKAEVEIEVECKSVSGDLGHRVHLRRQYQLGPYISPLMQTTKRDGRVRVFVVTLPDRLHGNREFMAAVGTLIVEALSKSRDVAGAEPCSVTYRELSITGSPFDCERSARINESDVIDYCNRVIGDEIGHTIMTFAPRRSATVIALRSAKPNTFLQGLYRNLREAASKQLSRTRPGIICVQLHVTSTQLREIAANSPQVGKPSGIQLMTAKFFDSHERNHVHTVAYTAPGNFVQRQTLNLDTQGIIKTTKIGEDAVSYFFINKGHQKVSDPRYEVFK
jgi:hypothetical protein